MGQWPCAPAGTAEAALEETDTVAIDRSACDAFLFDLDGVIARTGWLHAAAWKKRRVTDVAAPRAEARRASAR